MGVVAQRLVQIFLQLRRVVTQVWYLLRHPTTTGTLLVVLAMVLLLGSIMPRPPESTPGSEAAATWIALLPSWLQPWGDLLFVLGIARIFETPWFWLPVALLLLNSLIALADYAPGSWQRARRCLPSLQWQHPLARRVEHSVRLPTLPDDFDQVLSSNLREQGFFLYRPDGAGQRIMGATQHRWAWLGLVAVYSGLIGLIGAFVITYYTVQTDRFTLLPFQPRSSPLFQGRFELADVEPAMQGLSRVAYTRSGTESIQMSTWRLYQPVFLNNILILPVAINPMLTIEVRNANDALLKLVPLQGDLPPAERLSLSLDSSRSPLYFAIPAENLAIQISPDAATESIYHVEIRRGSESLPVENLQVQVGQLFQADKFTGIIFLNHNLTVVARRDPAWPLYLLSLILIGIGSILTFWRPPAVVWLVPEVKGMGGQLYGVMEKLGPARDMKQFLEELLAVEESPIEQKEASSDNG
ncbi:MAG: cytochrome c biogenesis protein ResB [Anaerolineae bacterium]|nr:cytochrome c biogenesis protein ResB [Anaerolineae bacterium]